MTDSTIAVDGGEGKLLRTDVETINGQLVHTEYVRDQKASGAWGYNAGVSGTLTLTGSKRVLLISAIAQEAAATITINGGDTITLPYGSTDKASSAIEIVPRGNLTDATIVFTGTKAYFCEWVTG